MVTWEARLISNHTTILVWWISSARFVDSIVFPHGASRSAFFDHLFHVTLAHLQKSFRESTEHLDLFILYTNIYTYIHN